MRISILLSGLSLLCCLGWLFFYRPFPATSSGVRKKLSLPVAKKLVLQQELGRKLFFDASLSNPSGQSCASCHAQNNAFADPQLRAVSAGAGHGLFGNRNALAITYSAYTPPFSYDATEENYLGGLFWDGRANTLAEQASGPLLNHLEMNTNKELVFMRLQEKDYRKLFKQAYGETALENPEKALQNLAEAVATFEETTAFSPFTSKFDYYKKGQADLTEQELLGLQLFNDPEKGNCAACHPSEEDKRSGKILFTDFTYDNIGLPANPEIIKLQKGNYKPDLGLGAIVKKPEENGKFKVPTLRNVALTAPYFHNGVIRTLEETVQFYNSRDHGKFGAPEIPENVNREELGNLKLKDQEVKAIVAFMQTLTDGYQPQ